MKEFASSVVLIVAGLLLGFALIGYPMLTLESRINAALQRVGAP